MSEEVKRTIQEILSTEDYFQKAKLIDFLLKRKHLTLKDLSIELKMKPSYVCHVMRLNKLPDIVIDGYYSKLISLSHLFVLSRLKDHDTMALVYERILSDNLTVLQTDYLVRESLHNIVTEGKKIPKEDIEDFIVSLLDISKDVSVRVVQTRIKARVQIEVKGSVVKTSGVLRQLFDKLQGKK
jgi:hypothetical protein